MATKNAGIAILALLGSLALAGCSNSADATAQSTAGSKAPEKLKVAVLLAGATSGFGQAVHDGFMNTAKDLNVEATAFDAGFDPNKQFSQLQTAIASGQYNAIAVHPIAPEQMCKTLQAQAAKGIAVIAMDQPVCSDPLTPFEKSAPEGITAFVGGDTSVDQLGEWAKKVVADNAGGKVLVLNGPEGSAITKILDTATQQAVSDSSAGKDVKIINAFTDFSQAMAQSQTASLLVSNPDISVIGVSGAEMARGALAAVKSTNAKNVKVYVYAGDQASIEMMTEGEASVVRAARPFTAGMEAAKLFADLQEGKSVPQLVYTPTSEPNRPPATLLTPENLGSYKAEY
ncbi:sugar ABC transporter substrate-binding protein [Paenarthrobacter sp. NPDC091711]|uniref:sugar ABC transporter substrate-binding protein n=1 Tax=Paenarthrobacter sp. NPDC091711 TaxID=3364385 RepID=UPI003814C3C7